IPLYQSSLDLTVAYSPVASPSVDLPVKSSFAASEALILPSSSCFSVLPGSITSQFESVSPQSNPTFDQ
ncbi:hypothetical protein U1Q18_035550, partial [Sarracenia purpurea var. burkii]